MKNLNKQKIEFILQNKIDFLYIFLILATMCCKEHMVVASVSYSIMTKSKNGTKIIIEGSGKRYWEIR
jgi:hypothetical protein